MFPNRIENDRNGNKATATVSQHFCYAVGFAAVFLSDAKRIHHKSGFIRNSQCSGGVTRQIHPTRRSIKLAQGKRITGVVGGRTPLYTRKSAATTWLQRTLGGVIVGLTTF